MGENPFQFHPTCGLCAALALGILLLAAPIAAAPIVETLFYDGYEGWGFSDATATGSGLPILSPAIDVATGYDTTQAFIPGTIAPGPPATASESWTVTNNTGQDRIGTVYLGFAKPLDSTLAVNGVLQSVSYDPNDVGLTLHNGAGGADWAIITASTPGFGSGNVYYPAVALGSLLDGQTSGSFDLDYVLQNPQIFADASGLKLGVPRWHIFTAFVPVPEPSTALLLGAGLAGLAFGRRRLV